jgi:phasin family protein
MLTAEQLVAAQKANLETLFELTNKAFEGVEKLVELNLQVAKASLTEVQATATAGLAVKDAQELLALQAGLLQPAAEKAAAYGRHLYDIAASTNAEVRPSWPPPRPTSTASSTRPSRTPRPAPSPPPPW